MCSICWGQTCSNAIPSDVISEDNTVDNLEEQGRLPNQIQNPRTKIRLPYTVNVKMKNKNKIVCDDVIGKFISPLEKRLFDKCWVPLPVHYFFLLPMLSYVTLQSAISVSVEKVGKSLQKMIFFNKF